LCWAGQTAQVGRQAMHVEVWSANLLQSSHMEDQHGDGFILGKEVVRIGG